MTTKAELLLATAGLKLLLATTALTLSAVAAPAEPLRVGLSPEPYMPFTQVNPAGTWEGLEADLTLALCDRLPDGCEFERMAWDGLMPSLAAGKVDVVVGAFSVTDERREVVDFSQAYYTEGTVLVAPTDAPASVALAHAPDGSGEIIDPAALKGLIVGVQAASVQAAYANAYFAGAEIKAYDTADNAVADLVAGRMDALLGPDLYMGEFLRTEEGSGFEVLQTAPTNPLLGEGVAYAVRRGDAASLAQVDGALAVLRDEGLVDRLVRYWITDPY